MQEAQNKQEALARALRVVTHVMGRPTAKQFFNEPVDVVKYGIPVRRPRRRCARAGRLNS